MKKFVSMVFVIICITNSYSFCQSNTTGSSGTINLIIRGDDMGSFHASNLACLEAYKKGIMRDVELMPVCPWFIEATKMLNENKGLDVGIHLALTSEWSNVKWRPLTYAPSLVDSDGYFFPMVWQNPNFPPNTSIQKSNWTIEDVEKELRAQIELAVKHVPHITHLSSHMGYNSVDKRIDELVKKLAKEYKLFVETADFQIKYFPGWDDARSIEERVDAFCINLEKLTPGTYLFVDHPALNVSEMDAVWHPGYENIGIDRNAVTMVYTSPKVVETIKKLGINLIGYKDLKNLK